jgi:hypothetical protein
LTCWNSITFQSWPSMLSTTPLRMSEVEAMSLRPSLGLQD